MPVVGQFTYVAQDKQSDLSDSLRALLPFKSLPYHLNNVFYGIWSRKIVHARMDAQLLIDILNTGGEPDFDVEGNWASHAQTNRAEPIVKWFAFCNAVVHGQRFGIGRRGIEIEEMLNEIFTAERLQGLTRIVLNAIYYRARIGNLISEITDLGQLALAMGPPPASQSRAGRANSAGIPVLYAAESSNTAAAEVRAIVQQDLTIAELHAEYLVLLDLSDRQRHSGSPFRATSTSQLTGWLQFDELRRMIGFQMANPVMPNDEAIQYIPTQYLAEFVRSNGFDGILYDSALDYGGRNLVIFNSEKVKFVQARTASITKIQHTVEEDVLPFPRRLVDHDPTSHKPH